MLQSGVLDRNKQEENPETKWNTNLQLPPDCWVQINESQSIVSSFFVCLLVCPPASLRASCPAPEHVHEHEWTRSHMSTSMKDSCCVGPQLRQQDPCARARFHARRRRDRFRVALWNYNNSKLLQLFLKSCLGKWRLNAGRGGLNFLKATNILSATTLPTFLTAEKLRRRDGSCRDQRWGTSPRGLSPPPRWSHHRQPPMSTPGQDACLLSGMF